MLKDALDNSKKSIIIKIGVIAVFVILVGLVLLVRFNKADSYKDKIVGTWQDEYGNTFVFQKDGKYSHSGGWFGNYQVEKDVLTLSPALNDPEIYKIEISSNSLTLYNTDGSVYVKLKKFK